MAAYEERLATMQSDAMQGRPQGLGVAAVVSASSLAKQLRRKPVETPSSPASQSQYFRREKVIIGLSACRLISAIPVFNIQYLVFITNAHTACTVNEIKVQARYD